MTTIQEIRKAISSLILSHPFFAGVLLQQQIVSIPEGTFAVDGESLFFNPEFAATLTFPELKGVLAHEALHLALGHHARIGNRDPELWNQAADYAINAELVAAATAGGAGLKLPAGALIDARFSKKSAEDVYSTLFREKQSKKPDPQANPGNSSGAQGSPQSGNGPGSQKAGNGTQNGGNQPSPSGPPSFGEVRKAKGPAGEALEKAKIQASKAESIARFAGGMPGGVATLLQDSRSQTVNWREILHRFFQELTRADYSFATPNRRFAGSDIILPSLRSRSMGRVVVAIDTSGSVSPSEVSAMVAECLACLDIYSEHGIDKPLRVIYCDATIQGEQDIGPGDIATPKGGGGTCFAPVFDYLANDIGEASCLIYLTDGWASDVPALATREPSYPVLWGLIQDNAGFAPPFGEVFRFDIHA